MSSLLSHPSQTLLWLILHVSSVQKLIAQLLKELDDFARIGIKDELASLDPLLRNVAVLDEARETHDYNE